MSRGTPIFGRPLEGRGVGVGSPRHWMAVAVGHWTAGSNSEGRRVAQQAWPGADGS